MSYNPAIDASTLFFALRSLALIDEQDAFVQNALLDIQLQSEKGLRGYELLLAVIAARNGAEQLPNGRWDIRNLAHGATNGGNTVLQFAFGLMCLSRVLEAICLGDRVHYLSGAGMSGVSLESQLGFYPDFEVRSDVWEEVELSDEEARMYKRIVEACEFATPSVQQRVRHITAEVLTYPYIELGALLNDASNGRDHPVVYEHFSPFVGQPDYINKEEVRASPFLNLNSNLVLLGRMHGYLQHGIAYELIAQIKKLTYLWNDFRAPFYAAIFGSKCSKREAVSEAVKTAVYGHSGGDKSNGMVEDVGMILLKLIISRAVRVDEVLKRCYELRQTLFPFRDLISKRGFTVEVREEIERCHGYAKDWNDIRSVGKNVRFSALTGGFDFTVRSRLISALFKPLSLSPSRRTVYTVCDRYHNSLALFQELNALSVRNAAARAENIPAWITYMRNAHALPRIEYPVSGYSDEVGNAFNWYMHEFARRVPGKLSGLRGV